MRSFVPVNEVQAAYRAFRKQYKNLLRNAKREMDTPLRKALIDTIAATAFNAAYNNPRKPVAPVTLKGWKAQGKKV